MTGTHRCSTPNCPFMAPANEDKCEFCQLFEEQLPTLASSRSPGVICLPHEE